MQQGTVPAQRAFSCRKQPGARGAGPNTAAGGSLTGWSHHDECQRQFVHMHSMRSLSRLVKWPVQDGAHGAFWQALQVWAPGRLGQGQASVQVVALLC
jgi:hypothetical protein